MVAKDCPLSHFGRRHVEAALRVPRMARKAAKTAPSQQHMQTSKSLPATLTTPPPLSPRTIEQTLRAIRALVAWAMKCGWIDKDITAEVVYDGGPEIMRPWLQLTEIDAFLAACSPAHRIRAGLIVETGLRA